MRDTLIPSVEAYSYLPSLMNVMKSKIPPILQLVNLTKTEDCTVFIRSRDADNPLGSKPMPTFDPEGIIGRTFLLPPEGNGGKHRGKVTRKVMEIIDQENGHRIENINFTLDIGNGKVEE